MANAILAAAPLSRNDVYSFANLIDETLQAYCASYSPLEREYLIALRTVIGLGFTAALVHGNSISTYEPFITDFIRYSDYKKHTSLSKPFALAIAETVNGVTPLFKIIRYPRYYDDFVTALKHIGYQMTLTLREKSEEINRLMKLLLN